MGKQNVFFALRTTLAFILPQGMPPLNSDWCQIMTTPRENVYESIDRAFVTAIVVFVMAFVGFLGAVALLVLSLTLAYRTNRARRRDARMQDLSRVRTAASDVLALIAPMAFMSAGSFLAMDAMVCMEHCRDNGLCKVLDSLDDIATFKQQGNRIILISHQWLGFKTPDTADALQLRAMQRFVQAMVKKFDSFNVFVWLDYISIAQRHIGQQLAAVASLPVYVSQVDIFAVCAPDASHTDTGARCGLETYSKRGWCRTEILAKVCSTGLDNMYLCAGDGLYKPFTKDDFDHISMNVYEGDFTVQSDCEKLVLPILGLYSLILRKRENEQMREMKHFIDENKSRFFPDSYELKDESGKLEKWKLFKNLVPLMEQYVEELLAVEASAGTPVTEVCAASAADAHDLPAFTHDVGHADTHIASL